MNLTTITRNLTVIARNATDGFYYAGFITKGITDAEDLHKVIFHNIKPQDVRPENVINIGGAVPWPSLKIGDYVLVAVRCRTSGHECYMPGRVMCLSIDMRRENRFYTVKLYTGRTTTKPRRYIVKIGQEKYQEISDYISNVRYRKPITSVSEPDLRGRFLARRHNEDINNKRRINLKRTLSADLFRRRRNCHHHHHHYHHLYHHSDRVRSLTESSTTGREISIPECEPHHSVTVGTQTDGESTDTSASSMLQRPTPPRSPFCKPAKTSSNSSGGSTSSKRREKKENIQIQEESSRLQLKRDTVVLARWSDDGWYYFGKVVKERSDGYFQVLDSTGYMENIQRNDIFSTDDNRNKNEIKQFDKVVALHPKYAHSYAPATVLDFYSNGYRVQFYDGTESELSEVYKIPNEKYKQDVEYIKIKELKISGLVIARDDVNGVYRPFMAVCPNHQTQQIFLQAQNNAYQVQEAIHVFLRDGARQKINKYWKYVIGPLDPACTVYLPAKIVTRSPFRLLFCNGQLNDHAKLSDCFYVSEDYFENAINYLVARGQNSFFSNVC